MERKKVDIRFLTNNGDFIVVSLADFNESDFKGFAAMFRPIWSERKDAVHVPMFENERSLCPDNVWLAMSALAQKGVFAKAVYSSYSELIGTIGKNGKTIYCVIKNKQIREQVIQNNASHARIIFCDLEIDGQLYWIRGVFTSRESSSIRRSVTQNDNSSSIRKPRVQTDGYKPRDYIIATKPSLQGIQRLVSTVRVSEGTILYD